MSDFVVSARKYRPATFRSVVGQRHITQTLQSAIAKSQLAHAYLFTGPRGVGKTTCARIFAKAINCTNPTPEHEACGECESCRAFDEGRSWGIHELDAASNNSVEDIRALIEKVRIPPQVGRYSVYIIDEVHMLSQAAFNAFLKTLEEPPKYAIFILATTEKHKILPTILSRCQSYDFRRIGVADIVDYLAYVAKSEQVTYDDESLNLIAQKADGGMRDALSTFDRVVSFSGGKLTFDKTAESIGALDFNTYFTAVDLARNEDYASLLMLYDSTLRNGFDGQIFVSGLAEHIRNLLVAKNPQTLPLLEVAGSLCQRYANQAAETQGEWIIGSLSLMTTTDAGYRTATNKRLSVELALMKLCGLKKKANYDLLETTPLPDAKALRHTQTTPTTPSTIPVTATTTTEITTTAEAAPTVIHTSEQIPAEQPSTEKITPIVATTVPTNNPHQEPISPQTIHAQNTNNPKTGGRIVPSITGISIKTGQRTDNSNGNNTAESALANEKIATTTDPTAVEKILTDNWQKIVDHWKSIGRPRISIALTVNQIKNNTILIPVANETLHDELLQNKLDIETSILNLLGVRADMQVMVTATKQEYKPVSVEQKLQYLIDRNPRILKLKEAFDLTL